MAFESLSDDKIADLLNCNKVAENPSDKVKIIGGIEKVNYRVVASDGSGHKFVV